METCWVGIFGQRTEKSLTVMRGFVVPVQEGFTMMFKILSMGDFID